MISKKELLKYGIVLFVVLITSIFFADIKTKFKQSFTKEQIALTKGKFESIGSIGVANDMYLLTVSYTVNGKKYIAGVSVSEQFNTKVEPYNSDSLYFNVLYKVSSPEDALIKPDLKYIGNNINNIDFSLYK